MPTQKTPPVELPQAAVVCVAAVVHPVVTTRLRVEGSSTSTICHNRRVGPSCRSRSQLGPIISTPAPTDITIPYQVGGGVKPSFNRYHVVKFDRVRNSRLLRTRDGVQGKTNLRPLSRFHEHKLFDQRVISARIHRSTPVATVTACPQSADKRIAFTNT